MKVKNYQRKANNNMKAFPILYKRAKKGQPQQWQIFCDGNTFWTEAGQVGGAITRTEPTVCESKNTGRANETTPEMQAEAEATAKHDKKLAQNYFLSIDQIDNGAAYFEPMLAKKFVEEKDKIDWKIGVTVQPKLDGIRSIISADGATTRKGKSHMCLGHIQRELKPLFDADPNLILDGEAYNHEFHDDFNEISSIIRKMKPSPADLAKAEQFAQFHCYDVPCIGKLTQDDPFIERYAALKILFHSILPSKSIFLVPNAMAYSESDVQSAHDEFLAQGYEGIIVRVNNSPYENYRSDGLMKYKEFDDDEFVIEDMSPGTGNKADMACTITIHTKAGVLCEPNIKNKHPILRSMLKNKQMYIGKTCTVRYFGVTPDGSLRFPYMIDIDRWLYE